MSIEFREFADEQDEAIYINPLLVRSFVAWTTYDADTAILTKIVFDNEHSIIIKGSPEQVAERLTILS